LTEIRYSFDWNLELLPSFVDLQECR